MVLSTDFPFLMRYESYIDTQQYIAVLQLHFYFNPHARKEHDNAVLQPHFYFNPHARKEHDIVVTKLYRIRHLNQSISFFL